MFTTKPEERQEQPNIVSSRWKRNAMRLIAPTHFAPVAVTLVLLCFYIAELPWVPPGPSDNVRSAIQIAAKIHEGPYRFSLTQILLHRFRYELMSVNRLPFGYLTVPYQLGSPLCFFSKAFRSATTTRTVHPRRQLCTAYLIIVSALLAIVSGPASAVVMLPRVGWWPVSNVFPQGHTDDSENPPLLDVYANASYAQLIPQTINASRAFLDYCATSPNETSYPPGCPYGGWQSLYDSLNLLFESKQLYPDIRFPDSDSEIFDSYVPSMNGTRLIFGYAMSTGGSARANTSSLAYSVTPPDFLAAVLSLGASRSSLMDRSPQIGSIHP